VNKLLTFTIRFFLLLAVPVLTYSQNNCTTFEGRQINCFDSVGNKIGWWLEFDVDSVVYKATLYSAPNRVVHTKFITKNGIEIEEYNMALNPLLIEELIKNIKANFNWGRVVPREGKGLVTLLLVINTEGEIIDIRVLRGIHPSFNEEVIRAAKLVEKDLIFICAKESQVPIVIIVPIRF